MSLMEPVTNLDFRLGLLCIGLVLLILFWVTINAIEESEDRICKLLKKGEETDNG